MRLQTRLEIRVDYAARARDCRRLLRVLPLHRAGQTVIREARQIAPAADLELEKRDAWGNRRLLLFHRRLNGCWEFALDIEAMTTGAPVLEFGPDAARWKMPSRAVVITPAIQLMARGAREMPALERAAHFAHLCRENLEYDARTDAFPLASNAIWARKRGNCADFAHSFLALCRASGLLARYVAGFSRSEGQMHAWAEVWADNYWHPFDPARDQAGAARPVHHIAVSVGRDFYDCAPHGGRFHGGAGARIEVWCRTQNVEDVGK